MMDLRIGYHIWTVFGGVKWVVTVMEFVRSIKCVGDVVLDVGS